MVGKLFLLIRILVRFAIILLPLFAALRKSGILKGLRKKRSSLKFEEALSKLKADKRAKAISRKNGDFQLKKEVVDGEVKIVKTAKESDIPLKSYQLSEEDLQAQDWEILTK